MFKIGDKIVYPMHGAGVITDIEQKEILGEVLDFFVIKLPIGNLKVMIPVNNVEEIGVRTIIENTEIQGVIDVLKGSSSSMPANWNRRYRANMDRIKSGDIYEIAAVVRNLLLLENKKGLSTGERKMLSSAKQMLVSEMILVTEKNADSIEELVLEAINQ